MQGMSWGKVLSPFYSSTRLLGRGGFYIAAGASSGGWSHTRAPRSYKAFSLENGLRVLLVEDSSVDCLGRLGPSRGECIINLHMQIEYRYTGIHTLRIVHTCIWKYVYYIYTHCLGWKRLCTHSIAYKWRESPKYIKVCDPTALLQDDGTDQLEVAFTLSFGQFDDPKDVPGLAHLTEHLLLSGPGPDGQQAGRVVDGEWSWKNDEV